MLYYDMQVFTAAAILKEKNKNWSIMSLDTAVW
jgi:hypothetical protein